MIKLVNVHKVYENEQSGFLALKDINLDFANNHFVCVLGKSGSGKTTLLNIIGGLDKVSTGHMVVDEALTTKFSERQWDYFRNYKIGFIFQNYSLIEHLTVLDNVMLGLKLQGATKEEVKQRALDRLEDVGVRDQADKLPKQLSGGQRQRVAIARALINDPEIILADEPTGALDKKTSKEVMDLLKKLSKDKLVIMVTHNKRLANIYADRIIELKDGAVIRDTQPDVIEQVNIRPTKRFFTTFKLKDKIKHAYQNLKMKKGRTILTALGLSIGIAGFILINALSSGLKENLNKQKVAFDNNPDYHFQLIGDWLSDEEIKEHLAMLRADKQIKLVHLNKNIRFEILQMDGDEAVEDLNEQVLYNFLPNNEEEQRYVGRVYGDGRWPANDHEIVISRQFAERLYDYTELDRLWEKLKGTKLTVAFDYYYVVPEQLQYLSHFTSYIVESLDTAPEDYDEERFGPYEDQLAIQMELFNRYLTEENYLGTNHTKIYFTEAENYYKYLARGEIKETREFTIVGINELNHINYSIVSEDAYNDYFYLPDYSWDVDPSVGHYSTQPIIEYYVFLDDELTDREIFDLHRQYTRDGFRIYDYHSFDFELPFYNIMVDIIGFVMSLIMFVSVLTAGIMLLMVLFISVMERSREIGILRSLGATKSDILSIFTVESGLIGVLAGIIGIGLSFILAFGANIFIRHQYPTQLQEMFNTTDINLLIIQPGYSVIAMFICVVLAMIFGLIPAIHASKKTPINALKRIK